MTLLILKKTSVNYIVIQIACPLTTLFVSHSENASFSLY